MSTQSGSLADWLSLEDAHHRFETARTVSAFLDLRVSSENERTRRCELAGAAVLCGWDFSEELTAWADRKLGTFRKIVVKSVRGSVQ